MMAPADAGEIAIDVADSPNRKAGDSIQALAAITG